MRAVIIAAAMALSLAACGAEAPEPQPDDPPSFDVRAVIDNFTAECADPSVVDEAFCEQVLIEGMAGSGGILTVPTLLNAAATARAQAICQQLAVAHFDGDGQDLGYSTVGILDRDGGNAAACSV